MTDTSLSTPKLRPTFALRSITLMVIITGLGAAPLWAGRADLRLLMEVFSFLALAQMWNLLAGYTGLISVGQQAFVGLGGYLFFALAMFLGLHPLAAMPLANGRINFVANTD